LARIFLPPTSQARALDQVVTAVPTIKAIKRSASSFGPNPSSPEAKEQIINVVACQESTRTEDFTLKAKKNKAAPARCRTVLNQAWSSVSCA